MRIPHAAASFNISYTLTYALYKRNGFALSVIFTPQSTHSEAIADI